MPNRASTAPSLVLPCQRILYLLKGFRGLAAEFVPHLVVAEAVVDQDPEDSVNVTTPGPIQANPLFPAIVNFVGGRHYAGAHR